MADVCAVCLDGEGNYTTGCCRSDFHASCMAAIVLRGQTCPKCRGDPGKILEVVTCAYCQKMLEPEVHSDLLAKPWKPIHFPCCDRFFHSRCLYKHCLASVNKCMCGAPLEDDLQEGLASTGPWWFTDAELEETPL